MPGSIHQLLLGVSSGQFMDLSPPKSERLARIVVGNTVDFFHPRPRRFWKWLNFGDIMD